MQLPLSAMNDMLDCLETGCPTSAVADLLNSKIEHVNEIEHYPIATKLLSAYTEYAIQPDSA